MDARMPAALLALSFWFWRAAVAASVTGLGVAALGAGWTSGTLGLVAQLAEQLICNQQVIGSSPIWVVDE